jgi:AmiR/NasT family two-component response regulator
VSHFLDSEHLRVLIANQRLERLDRVTTIVVGLGHEVIARSIEVEDVAVMTARERPDVALVGLGESSGHALDLIDQIVRAAACPVIAILETDDRDFINEAAKRGVFAYIANGDAEQLQSSIDIVLRPFAEFQNLEGAFARRALIERAKGILMERHDLDEVPRSNCCGRTRAARVASWLTSPAPSSTAERSCPARRRTPPSSSGLRVVFSAFGA